MTTSTDRSRRWRAHNAGDHHLCDPERCASAPAASRDDATGDATGDDDATADATPLPGSISAAVGNVLASLDLPSDDPRHVLAVVATRIAAALDASGDEPPAALIRELRLSIEQATETPRSQPADVVDELRAKRAARRVDHLLDHFDSSSRRADPA